MLIKLETRLFFYSWSLHCLRCFTRCFIILQFIFVYKAIQISDILQLLLTRNGQFDAVCSMDFDLLKLYDIWVTRDIEVYDV